MIEDDLRTMLRRRADDITVEPRPWTELASDDLQPSRLRPAVGRSRVWIPVAAAVLAVVVIAAVLVRASEDDPAVPVEQVSGVSRPFVPEHAAPVWLQGPSTSPSEAAAAYLADRLGVAADLAPPVFGSSELHAVVPWTRGGAAGSERADSSGEVFVRQVLRDGWLVVGATDDELAFDDLTFRDDRLRFSIRRATGASRDDSPASAVAVSVVADGVAVDTGGDTLPQGPGADADLGQLRYADESGSNRVDVVIPNGAAATVRVRQVGGGFLSIAEFVVQPEGGPPGGRLLTSGELGNKTWRLWAMDRAEGVDERPCVLLTLVAKTVTGPVCGIGPGNPDDRTFFTQLGPVAHELEQVLIFGVVDAQVDTVGVFPEVDDGVSVGTTVDLAYPYGARMFAVAVPIIDPTASVEFMSRDQLLGKTTVQVDGPVGG